MLNVLMYHRALPGKYGNALKDLEAHFCYLKKYCSVIYPQENLQKKSVILTFDDATADFYFLIYPLLKKYELKALLGVPAGFIQQKSFLPKETRIDLVQNFSFQKTPSSEAFCSYEELEEMEKSGFVKIACHSFSHQDLTSSCCDLDKEVLGSKALLERNLNIKIEDFILPYGKYTRQVIQFITNHYPRVYRIGNSVNFLPSLPFLSRISADAFVSLAELFSTKRKILYVLKSFKNLLESITFSVKLR